MLWDVRRTGSRRSPAELRIRPSVGTVADSYDNALASSVNSDTKTELVDFKAPWDGLAELQVATAQ